MKKAVLVILVLSIAIAISLPIIALSREVIQSQPSSDGKMEASLNQVKIRGNILSIRVTLKNTTDKTIEPEIHYKEFYYTDIKEKKKYFPLKDSKGNFLAGPQHSEWQGGTFKTKIKGGESRTIWLKFPAPPEATETVDLFVPGILPFEEVKISRSPTKE
jgi:hypothetical protein